MSYFEEHKTDFLEGLKNFLRIPSISTLPENKPDILRAAEFCKNELLGAGMTSAELPPAEKNAMSHRGQAALKAREILRQLSDGYPTA